MPRVSMQRYLIKHNNNLTLSSFSFLTPSSFPLHFILFFNILTSTIYAFRILKCQVFKASTHFKQFKTLRLCLTNFCMWICNNVRHYNTNIFTWVRQHLSIWYKNIFSKTVSWSSSPNILYKYFVEWGWPGLLKGCLHVKINLTAKTWWTDTIMTKYL
jgi:hypothetical protein